ncbi:hypothetical protein PR048_010163 [Dryococelus australis]|uniref:Uncharacterized protein n=1 Tax=Dryococelus australis TaxID=614101 RepID=A0ABQ9I1Y5_9NEOP|nr:hypothetical protein PR048_010163 [Dryococelus australis]
MLQTPGGSDWESNPGSPECESRLLADCRYCAVSAACPVCGRKPVPRQCAGQGLKALPSGTPHPAQDRACTLSIRTPRRWVVAGSTPPSCRSTLAITYTLNSGQPTSVLPCDDKNTWVLLHGTSHFRTSNGAGGCMPAIGLLLAGLAHPTVNDKWACACAIHLATVYFDDPSTKVSPALVEVYEYHTASPPLVRTILGPTRRKTISRSSLSYDPTMNKAHSAYCRYTGLHGTRHGIFRLVLPDYITGLGSAWIRVKTESVRRNPDSLSLVSARNETRLRGFFGIHCTVLTAFRPGTHGKLPGPGTVQVAAIDVEAGVQTTPKVVKGTGEDMLWDSIPRGLFKGLILYMHAGAWFNRLWRDQYLDGRPYEERPVFEGAHHTLGGPTRVVIRLGMEVSSCRPATPSNLSQTGTPGTSKPFSWTSNDFD